MKLPVSWDKLYWMIRDADGEYVATSRDHGQEIAAAINAALRPEVAALIPGLRWAMENIDPDRDLTSMREGVTRGIWRNVFKEKIAEIERTEPQGD